MPDPSPAGFPVTRSPQGFRFHRPTCSRVKRPVGDLSAFAHVDVLPAACCKPNAAAVRQAVMAAAGRDADAALEATLAVATGRAERPVELVNNGRGQPRHPVYLQALELKRAGGRGRGRRLSEAEMVARMRAAHEARPMTSALQEMEIAYWIDGVALSRSSWVALWDRTFGLASVAS